MYINKYWENISCWMYLNSWMYCIFRGMYDIVCIGRCIQNENCILFIIGRYFSFILSEFVENKNSSFSIFEHFSFATISKHCFVCVSGMCMLQNDTFLLVTIFYTLLSCHIYKFLYIVFVININRNKSNEI